MAAPPASARQSASRGSPSGRVVIARTLRLIAVARVIAARRLSVSASAQWMSSTATSSGWRSAEAFTSSETTRSLPCVRVAASIAL